MARNRYTETPTRSAELLRMALPLMARQKAAPHPVSYTIWYEYVAGINHALTAAIEELTAQGKPLDDDQTTRLYEAHVMGATEHAAQRVAADMHGVLSGLSESAQQVGSQTTRFDDSLSRWSERIEESGSVDPEALRAVLTETQGMRAAVGQLKTHLEDSQAEVARLQAEIERARDEALLDGLTGLPNRRAFEERIAGCVANGPIAHGLLIVDIDEFKRINDSFGHLFGDQVLKVVAKAIGTCVSESQLAARVGGEEFAVLLPSLAGDPARAVGERIRTTVAASRIRRRDSSETIGQVTVSIGYAALRAGETAEAWFDRADQALYASKQGGRNRLTCAPD